MTTGHWSLLCLALAAGASAGGAWCAAVGLPQLGVAAAADAGLDPGRLLLIAEPGNSWPQVVASLLDGCEIVLLCPPDRPSAQVRRKLEATIRRHGGVLVVAGDWDGAQTRLLVARQEWTGIGAGHGRLRARRVQVVADGRGAWSRPRARWLWLPAPDGSVATVAEGAGGAGASDTGGGWGPDTGGGWGRAIGGGWGPDTGGGWGPDTGGGWGPDTGGGWGPDTGGGWGPDIGGAWGPDTDEADVSWRRASAG